MFMFVNVYSYFIHVYFRLCLFYLDCLVLQQQEAQVSLVSPLEMVLEHQEPNLCLFFYVLFMFV